MIAIIIGIVCAVVRYIIAFGGTRKWPTCDHTPEVTVVIAARDEEKDIFNCLMSIACQNYPRDKYQIIVVNHLSKDNTGYIMDKFAEECLIHTRVVHVTEPDPVLFGKVHALNEAMKLVETEYVLQTDADVIVGENWIRSMVSSFTDNVVVVGGLVDIKDDGPSIPLVARMQRIDHRFFYGATSGLTGLAGMLDKYGTKPKAPFAWLRHLMRPSFASGNNMGFRLSAYNAIGGYSAIGPNLIEDHALILRLVNHTKKHNAFIVSPDSTAYTTAEPDVRSLLMQKRRWSTSTNVFDLLNVVLYSTIFLSRIVLPWMLLIFPLKAFLGILIVALGDALILLAATIRSNTQLRLRDFVIHEVYQVFMNHYLLFSLIFKRPVVWKGVKYHWKTIVNGNNGKAH